MQLFKLAKVASRSKQIAPLDSIPEGPVHPRIAALRTSENFVEDRRPFEAFMQAPVGGLSPVSLRSIFFKKALPLSPVSPVSIEKFLPEAPVEKPARSSCALLMAVRDPALFQSPGLVGPV